MPRTKTILLMSNDHGFARVLQEALGNGFRVLRFIGLNDPLPNFIVISADLSDWADRVSRLVQVKKGVAVVFAHPSPTGQKTALDLGAVLLFANDGVDLVRTTLRKSGLISE